MDGTCLKEVSIARSDSQKRNLRGVSKKLIPKAKRHTLPKSHGQHISGGKYPGNWSSERGKVGAEKRSCMTALSHLPNHIKEVVNEHPEVFSRGINAESGGIELSR